MRKKARGINLHIKIKLILITIVLSICLVFIGCDSKEVVIYTSVDQNIAEIILKEFEEETHIKVKAVYDIEASKTTGIANRLVSEKSNPVADVFWNSEIMMTIHLKQEGVLETYKEDLNLEGKYVDSDKFFVGFGGRARTFIYNTESDFIPSDLSDFHTDLSKAIANPLFGTTRTHSMILYDLYGEDYLRKLFVGRNTEIVEGNSVVRDLVANGQVPFGLTDTDDAFAAINKGHPVKIVYPDQAGQGTLVIPNTLALIKGHKNTEEAAILMAYLLSDKTENRLKELGFLSDFSDINVMDCDFERAFLKQEAFNAFMRDLLVD